jgi:hypothetical protein
VTARSPFGIPVGPEAESYPPTSHVTERALLHGYRNAGNARSCRVCGCTDAWGCVEGCWWVELDLCSGCAESVEEAPIE